MISTSFIFKTIAILLLLIIVASLFSAMFFLVHDKGTGERLVKFLTLRIALSIVLFLLLILGYLSGFVTPHGFEPLENNNTAYFSNKNLHSQ